MQNLESRIRGRVRHLGAFPPALCIPRPALRCGDLTSGKILYRGAPSALGIARRSCVIGVSPSPHLSSASYRLSSRTIQQCRISVSRPPFTGHPQTPRSLIPRRDGCSAAAAQSSAPARAGSHHPVSRITLATSTRIPGPMRARHRPLLQVNPLLYACGGLDSDRLPMAAFRVLRTRPRARKKPGRSCIARCLPCRRVLALACFGVFHRSGHIRRHRTDLRIRHQPRGPSIWPSWPTMRMVSGLAISHVGNHLAP